MSLAKTWNVGKTRKPATCGKCREEIPVGSSAVKFAVGFRGRTQVRCSKPECFPKPSERESSLVSSVYAAQEDADISTATCYEDLETMRNDVANAAREVAGEYEDSEMYEQNYDLQERAEILNSAADDLEGWEPEDEEPTEDDWDKDQYDSFEEAHEDWLTAARDSLQDAINDMELP